MHSFVREKERDRGFHCFGPISIVCAQLRFPIGVLKGSIQEDDMTSPAETALTLVS